MPDKKKIPEEENAESKPTEEQPETPKADENHPRKSRQKPLRARKKQRAKQYPTNPKSPPRTPQRAKQNPNPHRPSYPKRINSERKIFA